MERGRSRLRARLEHSSRTPQYSGERRTAHSALAVTDAATWPDDRDARVELAVLQPPIKRVRRSATGCASVCSDLHLLQTQDDSTTPRVTRPHAKDGTKLAPRTQAVLACRPLANVAAVAPCERLSETADRWAVVPLVATHFGRVIGRDRVAARMHSTPPETSTRLRPLGADKTDGTRSALTRQEDPPAGERRRARAGATIPERLCPQLINATRA
jgi:hypothetical protein